MKKEDVKGFKEKVEQLKQIFDRPECTVRYLRDDECKDFEVVEHHYSEETGAVRKVVKVNYTEEILIIRNHAINVQCNSELANLKIVAGALTGFYTFLGDDKKPCGYLGRINQTDIF